MKKRTPPEGWQHRLGTTALDPLQVIDLQDAIRRKKTKAIVQGREFELKYDGEMVFYRPTSGFVPCGYLRIKRFLEEW